ncbi:MAG: type II toxin-antitoxin system HicB family antitoxin [Candidatus Eremiobacterota bacterium]
MKYRVNIEYVDNAYTVWCPALPGCWSEGSTEEEALENIKDAIEGYLETQQQLAKSGKFRYVEVSV